MTKITVGDRLDPDTLLDDDAEINFKVKNVDVRARLDEHDRLIIEIPGLEHALLVRPHSANRVEIKVTDLFD